MALTPQEIRELPYDPRKVADPNLAVPDLSQALVGWRAWAVPTELPRYGLPPKLYSATNWGRLDQDFKSHYFWAPKRAALAECPYHDHEDDEIPDETCTCGFYSAKSLKHLLRMGYHGYDTSTGMVKVIGKCACWGKVIEGSKGWRSGKAYPVALYLPYEAAKLAKPLTDAYGCPTTLMNFLKMTEEAV